MIDRKKFDDLTGDERLILGESIGLPDYDDNDELFEQLNQLWGTFCDEHKGELGVRTKEGDASTFIEVVKKL